MSALRVGAPAIATRRFDSRWRQQLQLFGLHAKLQPHINPPCGRPGHIT